MIQNCVYRFINVNNEVIYVGKCKNLSARIYYHINEPHLDKQCYSEVRQIQYVSFPTYMDAGIMERIFIAHYQPKYNTQFTKEGGQSIISSEQLNAFEWTVLAEYPDGFPLNKNKRRRMGVLDKADFILFDGEGSTAEVYFYKIVKQNHKPKALKIVGAYGFVFDETYRYEPVMGEILDQTEREQCNQSTEYPMRFIKESDWMKLEDYYNCELKLPIIYKGYKELRFGDERTPFRYHCRNESEPMLFDISYLAILGALEILIRYDLIDESSIIGKPFAIPDDYSNISFSKVFKSNKKLS